VKKSTGERQRIEVLYFVDCRENSTKEKEVHRFSVFLIFQELDLLEERERERRERERRLMHL